jgi:vacuolar-type H+-ATPase subunit E/Vma4
MEPDVQRIIDRILQDAREKAESILAEAQRSAEMLLEDRRQSALQRAEKDEHSILERAEIETDAVRGRAIADAKRNASWLVLSEKERLVSSVLNEVSRRLQALHKSEEYIPVLEKMIVDAGTVLGGGKLEVVLNEDDLSLPLRMNELAEVTAEKTGVRTQLKLSSERIDAHGVVVGTPDGRIVLDNTFQAIIKRREKQLRLRISKILFGRARKATS